MSVLPASHLTLVPAAAASFLLVLCLFLLAVSANPHSLAYNDIGVRGASNLASALAQIESLQELDLVSE